MLQKTIFSTRFAMGMIVAQLHIIFHQHGQDNSIILFSTFCCRQFAFLFILWKMSDNTTDTSNSNSNLAVDPPLAKVIKFWLLLLGESLSIPCYVFSIYHLLSTKTAREALHNHTIVLILIFNLIQLTIDLSMTVSYLRLGYVVPSSPVSCLIWQFVDFGIWYTALLLMLWSSIERHILIFHSHLVATVQRRIFVHFMPLIVVSCYAPVFYTYLIFIYPCTPLYDYSSVLCGGPCYYSGIPVSLVWYETIAHYIVPVLLIAMFNIALLLRVIQKKCRLHRAVNWRQCRKMTVQLVSIASVFLLSDLPFTIVQVLRWSGHPDFATDIAGLYLTYLTYLPAIGIPFVTLGTIPELKKKVNALFFFLENRQAVRPNFVPTN